VALRFRLATTADADGCNEFQRSLLKRSRSTAQWRWEFAEGLDTDIVPYALALDGDRIVGSQALIRVPMRGPDGRFMTTKGEDALVHPRFWGQDILKPLWNLLIEWANQANVRLIWGFNSRRPVFEKLGFTYLDSDWAVSMIRPLSAAGLRRIALFEPDGTPKPARRVASWRHRLAANSFVGFAAASAAKLWAQYGRAASVIRMPPRIGVRDLELSEGVTDRLLDEFVRRTGAITADRTATFVRWRLVENPWALSRVLAAYRGGDLVGLAAFAVLPDGVGMITDLIVCDPEGNPAAEFAATFSLLARATRELASRGALVARFPIVNDHCHAAMTVQAAKRLGYLSNPARVGACVLPVSGRSLDLDLLDHRRWHFTNINTEGREG
jgi:hypothetical protein